MASKTGWVRYRCACGFHLDAVPRDVLADLPRCLGCGKTLRTQSVRVNSLTRVSDLR